MQGKSGTLRLLIEIDKASWARLQLSLVISVDSTELQWVNPMVVKGLFALSMACDSIDSGEASSGISIDIFLIFFREELLVFPNLIQYARTSFWRWVSG